MTEIKESVLKVYKEDEMWGEMDQSVSDPEENKQEEKKWKEEVIHKPGTQQ